MQSVNYQIGHLCLFMSPFLGFSMEAFKMVEVLLLLENEVVDIQWIAVQRLIDFLSSNLI